MTAEWMRCSRSLSGFGSGPRSACFGAQAARCVRAGRSAIAQTLIALAALALGTLGSPAAAHKASDSYLQLREQEHGIELRWDIALRDLDSSVELDANGDAQITWAEIKAAWPAVEAYALQRIGIDACQLRPVRRGLEQRSDGAYAVLWLEADCALSSEPVVRYSLLREIDPTHRGLLKIERAGRPVMLQVLDPTREHAPLPAAVATATEAPTAGPTAGPIAGPTAGSIAGPTTGSIAGSTAGSTAGSIAGPIAAPIAATLATPAPRLEPAPPSSFMREGVHHIVSGYDHLLFLLCLLLPAVMRRTPQGWQPVARLGQAVLPAVGIVSAFTLAHSMTLTLAALKLVSLPSSFIEPAIAVTIVLTAIDNLRPLFRMPRVMVAFFFGLIHGFGFAGVLAEMDLPAASFAWALLQFNLGLELGQLSIVFVAMAALYALRRRSGYPRWVINGGSLAALAIGALWFVERTADVSLLSL